MSRDIFKRFEKYEPINKGWSSDKKYRVETSAGQRMLLRVSDTAEYERKKTEFEMMERVYNHGVLTPKPVEFGLCDDGKSCYSLSGWIDGEDAETALPLMPEAEQYALGLKAGELLRKMHTVPAPETAEPWRIRFGSKVRARISEYNSKPDRHSDVGELLVYYLEMHRDVLVSRPQTFTHGDYNTENIILMPNGEVSVIDFNSHGTAYGDPWWDLDNMSWMPTMFPHFYSGQIRGYFGGEPPVDFWGAFAYYLAYDALGALTNPYGINGVEDGTPIVNNILNWTDNLQNPVPTWYLKDFHVQYIDGIPFKLKEPFDFSFLSKYGKVFKVYDDQDSGNICFGVADGENKYFVKFAGAPTERANISTEEAISRMKSTVPIYQDLAHPALTRLISSGEIVDAESLCGGFAMIFEWTDAECMGRQYPQSREKFMQMPIDTKLRVFDDILDFHAYIAAKGYVAIDFYDGSLMYDFNLNKTVICDVEFYAKAPYTNKMGRMWGSSRFMSPEEFELGAAIDEITNVYAMGAMAFSLFGDEERRDRRIEDWKLSRKLYDVAKRAVSDERSERQQSIRQFIEEWGAAK